MSYIILKNKNGKRHDDAREEYYLTSADNFTEMNFCETYSSGFQPACCDIGCYSFENSNSNYDKDLLAEIKKSNSNLPDEFEEEYFDCNNLKEVQELLADSNIDFDIYEKFPEEHTQARAWTYWDGSNFNSIVLAYGDNVTDCLEFEEIDELEGLDANEIHELLDQEREGDFRDAKRTTHTLLFDFTETQYASDPFICEIEINERDYETKDGFEIVVIDDDKMEYVTALDDNGDEAYGNTLLVTEEELKESGKNDLAGIEIKPCKFRDYKINYSPTEVDCKIFAESIFDDCNWMCNSNQQILRIKQ